MGSSGGGGGGAMRADNVGEVDYWWTGNKALGVALGLNENRFIKLTESNTLNTGEIDKLKGQNYHPTNVPWDKDTTTLEKTPTNVFKGSEILYLKKFKTMQELNNEKNKKKNKPDNPLAPRIPRLAGKDFKYMAASNPEVNRALRKKQKELSLNGGNASLRQNAGGVMWGYMKGEKDDSQFKNYFDTWKNNVKNGYTITSTASSLSATDFANFVIEHDNVAKEAWKFDNKNCSDSPVVPTEQEWCHLYGHGDGGQEIYDNFVSGSKHCNTEQLAIETGQRKGKPGNLTVRITAYLVPSNEYVTQKSFTKDEIQNLFKVENTIIIAGGQDGLEKYLTENFFDDNNGGYELKGSYNGEKGFVAFVKSKIDGAENNKPLRKALSRMLAKYANFYYPLARWIRYKIYHKDQKIFDHIFDAQSQSFNYHEFKILKTTVERVIHLAINNSDFNKGAYEGYINGLLKKQGKYIDSGSQKKYCYEYQINIVTAISSVMSSYNLSRSKRKDKGDSEGHNKKQKVDNNEYETTEMETDPEQKTQGDDPDSIRD